MLLLNYGYGEFFGNSFDHIHTLENCQSQIYFFKFILFLRKHFTILVIDASRTSKLFVDLFIFYEVCVDNVHMKFFFEFWGKSL